MGILETLMGLITVPLRDTKNDPDYIKEAKEQVNELREGMDGLNGGRFFDPIPKFDPTKSEKVISNNTNAWIVIGRDRPSFANSGYGGNPTTGAGSIDLVVGRNPTNPDLITGPNFITDAARIHISQTTDVDKNFGLAAGNIGRIDARSAIGMKADEIRVVGRNGIKLVTEGRGVENSKRGKIKTTVGIDLIAGNDTGGGGILGGILGAQNATLQPIPKGYEVVDCLLEMMGMIDDLAALCSTNATQLIATNTSLAGHFHISPFLGIPTTPSPTAMGAAVAGNIQIALKSALPMYPHRANSKTFIFNYLKPAGKKWICSRFNNTN